MFLRDKANLGLFLYLKLKFQWSPMLNWFFNDIPLIVAVLDFSE
jgi:hypothetical protein